MRILLRLRSGDVEREAIQCFMAADWDLKATLHTADFHLQIDQPCSTATTQQQHVIASEEETSRG